MNILAAFITWIGVILAGLGIVMLILLVLANAGVGDDALSIISFVLGFPVGIGATLSALAVYDWLA